MAQGKTRYDFQIVNPNDIQNLMIQFLTTNNFKQINDNGLVYYKCTDYVIGNTFIEYYINGNQLTIFGYVNNPNLPHMLDDDFVMSVPKNKLKGLLNTLFQEIQRVNSNIYNQSMDSYTLLDKSVGQNYNQVYQQNNSVVNPFQNNLNKRNGTMAIVGFILSLIMFFASFLGVVGGVILYIAQIYLSIQGIKSDKKGLAIVSLILTGLSFLITIGLFILSILFA